MRDFRNAHQSGRSRLIAGLPRHGCHHGGAAGATDLVQVGTGTRPLRDRRDCGAVLSDCGAAVLPGSWDLARLARFGRWHLACPDGGGTFGQPLLVTLLPSRRFVPTGELDCRLRCVRAIATGTPGQRSHRVNTVTEWEARWSMRTSTIHPGIGLAVTVPVPEVGLGTQRDTRTASEVKWQLHVHLPAERLSADVTFEIPIATVPDTDGAVGADIMREVARPSSYGA